MVKPRCLVRAAQKPQVVNTFYQYMTGDGLKGAEPQRCSSVPVFSMRDALEDPARRRPSAQEASVQPTLPWADASDDLEVETGSHTWPVSVEPGSAEALISPVDTEDEWEPASFARTAALPPSLRAAPPQPAGPLLNLPLPQPEVNLPFAVGTEMPAPQLEEVCQRCGDLWPDGKCHSNKCDLIFCCMGRKSKKAQVADSCGDWQWLPNHEGSQTYLPTCNKHEALHGVELRRAPDWLQDPDSWPGQIAELWISLEELRRWLGPVDECQVQEVWYSYWMHPLGDLAPVKKVTQYRGAVQMQLHMFSKDRAWQQASNMEFRKLLEAPDGAHTAFTNHIAHTIPLQILDKAPKMHGVVAELPETVDLILKKLSEDANTLMTYSMDHYGCLIVQKALYLHKDRALVQGMQRTLLEHVQELCEHPKGEGCANAAIKTGGVQTIALCLDKLSGRFARLATNYTSRFTVQNLIFQCLKPTSRGTAWRQVSQRLVGQLEDEGVLNMSDVAREIALKARELKRAVGARQGAQQYQ